MLLKVNSQTIHFVMFFNSKKSEEGQLKVLFQECSTKMLQLEGELMKKAHQNRVCLYRFVHETINLKSLFFFIDFWKRSNTFFSQNRFQTIMQKSTITILHTCYLVFVFSVPSIRKCSYRFRTRPPSHIVHSLNKVGIEEYFAKRKSGF